MSKEELVLVMCFLIIGVGALLTEHLDRKERDCMKENDKRKTYKENEIYDFLVKYISKNLYSPSIREIQEAVGLKSTSSVEYNLQKLIDDGRIEMKEGEPRTIKLVGYKMVVDENRVFGDLKLF